MYEKPVTYDYDSQTGLCAQRESLKRRLSNLEGIFADDAAYEALRVENPMVYEFHDMGVPESAGALAFGTSICYPGKVGREYYMTKGHFHEIFDTAETYYCLNGHGCLLMETPEGEWAAEELVPGRVVYVPGGWAHRSINVGSEPFITFFTFRGDAGHDYATIEDKGFRKLIVEQDGKPVIVDNPKWGNR